MVFSKRRLQKQAVEFQNLVDQNTKPVHGLTLNQAAAALGQVLVEAAEKVGAIRERHDKPHIQRRLSTPERDQAKSPKIL